MKNIFLCVMAVPCILGCVGCGSQGARQESKEKFLVLAENGRANYVIVAPEAPSAVDTFAIDELSRFLRQSTGAEFKVEDASNAAKKDKRIFVGLSDHALRILRDNPLGKMEEQEHVARSIGDDIFLYGKGAHGNLYGVYDFLENSVGCRWFTAFGGMSIPKHNALRLQAFNRQSKPAFQVRSFYTDIFFLRPEAMLFLYRNRLNLYVERHAAGNLGIVDDVTMIMPASHTMFSYIPPQENERKGHGINSPLKFLINKNYFKSNPDFFSTNKDGKRIDTMQLCFGNKQLRHALTENILENIKINGGKGIVTLDANDIPGRFCHCPECAKLEEKHACTGGPLFDYLVELCGVLKREYPEVTVKTMAYRKDQSQKPPRIDKLPDNLIVIFAPIDDNFAADWSHSSNAETYQDLKEWCKLAKNIWVWYYTNPGVLLPYGNIERLVNDIRLMAQAGVKGIFCEQGSGVTEGLGFTALQTYLMLKLMQNPNQNADTLIDEFMAYQYGKAADLMRQYLDNLEKCRKEMEFSITYSPSPGVFKYLTADNLLRWEHQFDKMEALVKDNPEALFNVQQVRVLLDKSVLQGWQQAKNKHPEYFRSAKALEERIHKTYDRMINEHVSPSLSSFGNNLRKHFYADLDATMLFAENPVKPLPKIFSGIHEDNIKRVVPTVYQKQRIIDDAAAFGLAGESVSEKPFQFGFYDRYNKQFGLSQKLQLSDIKPGAYHLYKLGTVTLTPDCLVWLGAKSWAVSAKLEAFYEPGVPNKWDVYVSMKFEGPLYMNDSTLKEDRVLCDQVVLVKGQ